jgi:hypothetical protein
MWKSRVPAVIFAVAIGGAGLAACGSSASSSTAALSTATSSATPGASASSSSPTASPTQTHSAAVKSSSAAAAPETTSPTHVASIPHAASTEGSTSSGTHNFTVPIITGDNLVTGHGSYTKVGTESVKVTICAQQTGAAFSVGTEALVYNSSGGSQNLGAVILTGPGAPTCVSETIPFYTAHLKVHAFIGGDHGTIVKTGPVLTLY